MQLEATQPVSVNQLNNVRQFERRRFAPPMAKNRKGE